MKLVSYSQNHEDILLWRALKHVDAGVYVDVGANDPIDDSVTKLFYDRGWRGINIEPDKKYFSLLEQDRPFDVNLNCAAGSHDGNSLFFNASIRGLSTSLEKVGDEYVKEGLAKKRKIKSLRLESILDQNKCETIHFLKIDVEGSEIDVLKGMNFDKYRPWVLVIEAIHPITQDSMYHEWESIVLSGGYQYAFFDGLNRYYIAVEHADLLPAFSSQPNVLDDFETISVVRLAEQLAEQKTRVDVIKSEADSLKRELQAIYSSNFWRIAQLMRKLIRLSSWKLYLRILFSRLFVHFPKYITRSLLDKILAFMDKHPHIRYRAVSWLHKFPRFRLKLSQLVYAHRLAHTQSAKKYFVTEVFDGIECDVNDQNINAALSLPLPSGRRKIYIYVDHTVVCPTNTGVQRVTRGIAAGFRLLDEDVRYVKWDAYNGQCILINMRERHHLARWNGPPVEETELDIYPINDGEKSLVSTHAEGENHWLIVPEVTHINCRQFPVTLDLLQWSRRIGLKVGFIYYDAIPLRRDELYDTAPRHSEYMQQLLLADVVWPISQWSADDLIAFWVKHECASRKTIPEVEVIHLSGELQLCTRILNPQEGEMLILSVGSIEPRKNQVQLIKAFELYRKLHPNNEWRLTLVGNLHPSVAEEVVRAQHNDKAIQHVGHISDEELDTLYRSCAFTVFPSVEEGFGLPILESLWYGKPCVCANFGAMAEIAAAGGCYTVDTHNLAELEKAIESLITDDEMRHRLVLQAVSRFIPTWSDYGSVIQACVEKAGHPERTLGRIYYWIDATLQFQKNTGIQRVSRQLARSLMELDVELIPVKWDEQNARFSPASFEELTFFAKWNGPDVSLWHDWIEPDAGRIVDWFFMPDLPLNRSSTERRQMLEYVRKVGLRCSAIFYDAIPCKMRDIYPVHFSEALHEYMIELAEYDRVIPISSFVRDDLICFLGMNLTRPQGLDSKIKSISLPGEFPESERITSLSPRADGPIMILCVGTVEPRKNHEILLKAFEKVVGRTNESLQLILVGGDHSIEPALAKRVRDITDKNPNVTWLENADDNQLKKLHLDCDFTVYPSVEEGFGLPILESLWYAKPCVCADFGAMREVADDGGCLMVDVRSVDALAVAIQRMVEDATLRETLALEAIGRTLKSWQDYALEVAIRLVQVAPVVYPELSLTKNEIEKRAIAMNLIPRPKLSICISTYNRADWLAVSLKNWSRLYPEPFPSVELLVCDNASTDHTREVVKPYLERSDFCYRCNEHNVGMLGNLKETTHHANGEYVWILGDDDLLIPGAIERVIDVLRLHSNVALVYLNYAFTRLDDARAITDIDSFFRQANPIVPAESDLDGPIRTICARNENFFTAIYTLVFRRDHAIKAYSQDTCGRPFSTMLTCIPTTYYVLNNMMDELGVWIGEPQVVVNMNVSWLKYAPLWILERIPEVYEIAEERGVSKDQMDRWRVHSLTGVVRYFGEIFEDDPLNNADYFKPDRLIRRFKHLPEFAKYYPQLREIYVNAYNNGHSAAKLPVSVVFPEN